MRIPHFHIRVLPVLRADFSGPFGQHRSRGNTRHIRTYAPRLGPPIGGTDGPRKMDSRTVIVIGHSRQRRKHFLCCEPCRSAVPPPGSSRSACRSSQNGPKNGSDVCSRSSPQIICKKRPEKFSAASRTPRRSTCILLASWLSAL